MYKFIFITLFIVSCSTQKQSKALVPWNSEESAQRLDQSEAKTDFFSLANNFSSQNNKLVCGLASSTIILNTLRLRKSENLPKDKTSISESEKKYITFDPYLPKYTQENILSSKTKKKIEVLGKPINLNGEMKKDYGLQLRQLAHTLETHHLNITLRIADKNITDKQIKNELIKNLKTKNDYILVNYQRNALGQEGGGHISPLGAYDQKTDSFLIMDVNPNKAPWVWVRSDILIKAMRTFDMIENRGYLLISEK